MALPYNKILLAYSVVLTTVIAGITATQAFSDPQKQTIDTLDVHRINLVEDDGTLRLVLANKSHFPGAIFKGKEYPHPNRDSAGMIFFNDEGTENGGLIFGGQKGKDGKVQSYGHLSFDQYEQDQVVTLDQSEYDGHRAAGLGINDYPSEPMDIEKLSKLESMPDGPEKKAELQKLIASGAGGTHRAFFGKKEGTSLLALQDAKGKPRLVLKVSPEGEATIQFLDADGKVQRTVTPAG
ncbi:MAG TPA: hypothetical protein VGL66_12970 [Caulobacteraceae bacterium]|jgi:hypothetical protein